MIYLFRIDNWVKLGFSGDVWRRAVLGWTANVHPPDLCGKLHSEDAELLGVWRCAEEAVEKALHSELAGGTGEFYPATMIDDIVGKLAHLERLEPPARPDPEEVLLIRASRQRAEITRPCCTGRVCVCYTCGRVLSSFKQLGKHRLTHLAPEHTCRCGKAFRRSDQLLAHSRRCHRSRSR